jgi:hypothetical protein
LTASSIKVNPATRTNARDVVVDTIDDVDHPLYKQAYGDADSVTRVDEDNPLPIKNEAVFNGRMLTALNELIIEMKINNAYQALGHDCVLTEEDLK